MKQMTLKKFNKHASKIGLVARPSGYRWDIDYYLYRIKPGVYMDDIREAGYYGDSDPLSVGSLGIEIIDDTP